MTGLSGDVPSPAACFASARNTAVQHHHGDKCFHCTPGGCRQLAWAIEELGRHRGGRLLLEQLGLPRP